MQVLMPESDTAGAAATARLRDAGHRVVTCHATGERWCVALQGGRCPLDTEPIDIALLVRPSATTDGLPYEDGVVCAAARGIPLVVAGSPHGHPYGPWAAADDEGSDVEKTLQTVMASPMPSLSVTATAALRATLSLADVDPGSSWAPVYRRNGGLLIEIVLGDSVPADTPIEVAAVRIAGAVRAVDPWSKTIDVSRSRSSRAAGSRASRS
jgi:hypothetical protein